MVNLRNAQAFDYDIFGKTYEVFFECVDDEVEVVDMRLDGKHVELMDMSSDVIDEVFRACWDAHWSNYDEH